MAERPPLQACYIEPRSPIDIISIAQQARPKVIGQMEPFRIQFTAESSVVNYHSFWRGIAEGQIFDYLLAVSRST